uniref:Uncharacterized protein n=1 Tax=viral metagenome TaxID=1070528 RepID=A0A6M3KX41_9ZZZZ
MRKKIVWESKHYEFNSDVGRLEQYDEHKVEKPSFESEYDAVAIGDEHIPIQKIMHTPFGLWSVDDSMNPFRQFKFWMGHTNFSIGRNAESILRHTPGVEVLRIITRYRFIVGIGRLFKIRDVRIYINKTLCGTEDVTIEKN